MSISTEFKWERRRAFPRKSQFWTVLAWPYTRQFAFKDIVFNNSVVNYRASSCHLYRIRSSLWFVNTESAPISGWADSIIADISMQICQSQLATQQIKWHALNWVLCKQLWINKRNIFHILISCARCLLSFISMPDINLCHPCVYFV